MGELPSLPLADESDGDDCFWSVLQCLANNDKRYRQAGSCHYAASASNLARFAGVGIQGTPAGASTSPKHDTAKGLTEICGGGCVL